MSSKLSANPIKVRRVAKLLGRLPSKRALKVLAHCALSVGGLKPAIGPASETLLDKVRAKFNTPALKRDESTFASLCLDFAVEQGEIELLDEAISAILSNGDLKEAFLDPLFAADSFALLCQDDKSNGYRATQFFTPRWVADLIAVELLDGFAATTREGRDFRLLDPACGGGHLLVATIEQLLSGEAQEDRKLERLKTLLANSLVGIDIDRTMLSLSALSLYLACRRLSKDTSELPVPSLYLANHKYGSLALGAGQAHLQRLTEPGSGAERLAPASFDGVVLNPPYQSTRTMDSSTAEYLKKHFPVSSGDLYTAFIELSMRFLKEGGRLSTICQQSILTIKRYQNLRLALLSHSQFISCLELGTGVFPSLSGEKCNTAILCLSKGEHEKASPLKIINLTKAANSRETAYLSQKSLRERVSLVEGNPLVISCPEAILRIFAREQAIGRMAQFSIVNGLFTCNNRLFVKESIEQEKSPTQPAEAIKDDEEALYVPYDKGGGGKWYRETKYRLAWGKDGEAIRDYRASRGQSRSLPGEKFYFKDGVTYSYIGTRGFTARLLSPGSAFDIASSAIFSDEIDRLYTVGFLNSALSIYLLSILNPTVNFQIGDLRRLPFKLPDDTLAGKICTLSQEAIDIVKDYKLGKLDKSSASERELAVQATIDNLIFNLYSVENEEREVILANRWVQNARAKTFSL